MGLLQRIASAVTRWLPTEKAAAGPSAFEFGGGGQPSWADAFRVTKSPSISTLLNQFKETVYACAVINATAVASVPFHLYVRTGQEQARAKCLTAQVHPQQKARIKAAMRLPRGVEVEEVESHPILDLLWRVNEWFDCFELFELTQEYQEVAGVAYWYLEPSALGVPGSIWLLPPHQVEPIRGGKGQIVKRYEYKVGKGVTKFPPEQVIRFAVADLRDPYLTPRSPTRAAYESITVSHAADSFIQALLDNMARPDIIFAPKEWVGGPEAERMSTELKRHFRKRGAGGVMVLPDAVTPTTLTFQPRELQMAELSDSRRKRIANCFGVPWSMLETESVNRANAEAGQFQHATNAVVPRLARLFQKLNQSFTPLWDPRLLLWFDDPVQANVLSDVMQQKADMASGILTINEVREDRGLEPVEGGDVPLVPSSMVPLPDMLEPTPPPPPPVPPPAPGEEPEEPEGDEEEEKLWQAVIGLAEGRLTHAKAIRDLMGAGWKKDSAIYALQTPLRKSPQLAHHEHCGPPSADWAQGKADRPAGHGRRLPTGRELKRMLERFLRSLAADLLKHLKALYGRRQKLPPSDGWWQEPIDLKALGYADEMAKSVGPAISVQYEAGAREALTRIGATNAEELWSITLPQAREAAEHAAMALSDSTLATISGDLNSAMDQLRRQIAEGVVGRENTVRELTRRVRGVVGDPYRAERIAVTESSRALHAGQKIAAKASGNVVGFRWLLSGDACPICQDIASDNPDGISLDGAFGNDGKGGAYSSIEHPPAHPNCLLGETSILVAGARKGFVGSYDGPAVRIMTARGVIAVTAQHMLLTPEGFARASSLREGDELIYCFAFEREVFGGPDDDGKPAPIQEVVTALTKTSRVPPARMPVAPEYLHGDGAFMDGNIDIIAADGLLNHRGNATALEHLCQPPLTPADAKLAGLSRSGDLASVLFALRDAADGGVGGRRESPAFRKRQRLHPEAGGFAAAAQLGVGLMEPPENGGATNTQALGDLIRTLASQVTLCHVLKIESFHFSGSVYDLETASSLYLAGGLVSSNCMCTITEILGEGQPVEFEGEPDLEYLAKDDLDAFRTARMRVPTDSVDYDRDARALLAEASPKGEEIGKAIWEWTMSADESHSIRHGLTAKHERYRKVFSDLAKNSQVAKGQSLYRGVSVSDERYNAIIDMLKTKREWQPNILCSTSTKRALAEEFAKFPGKHMFVEIRPMPGGALRGVNITPYSPYRSYGNETIIPQGKFRLLKMEETTERVNIIVEALG